MSDFFWRPEAPGSIFQVANRWSLRWVNKSKKNIANRIFGGLQVAMFDFLENNGKHRYGARLAKI